MLLRYIFLNQLFEALYIYAKINIFPKMPNPILSPIQYMPSAISICGIAIKKGTYNITYIFTIFIENSN